MTGLQRLQELFLEGLCGLKPPTIPPTPLDGKMNPFPQEFLTVFSFILCLSPLLFLHVAIQVCPFCESAPAFSLTDTGDSNITLKLKVATGQPRGVFQLSSWDPGGVTGFHRCLCFRQKFFVLYIVIHLLPGPIPYPVYEYWF